MPRSKVVLGTSADAYHSVIFCYDLISSVPVHLSGKPFRWIALVRKRHWGSV